MLRQHARRTSFSLMLGTIAIACSSLFEPIKPDAIFAIARAVDVGLSSDVQVRILADTFVFINETSGVRRTHFSSINENDSTWTSEMGFEYRVEARRVGIVWQCPAGAICSADLRYDWFDRTANGFTSEDRRMSYLRVDN